MTDSNERWADSSEKPTDPYEALKDSTALGRGSDDMFPCESKSKSALNLDDLVDTLYSTFLGKMVSQIRSVQVSQIQTR